jgi:hypothetical protein
MTAENFCFYLQNRLIQTSQTGGQQYSDTSPLVFPGLGYSARKALAYLSSGLFAWIVSNKKKKV